MKRTDILTLIIVSVLACVCAGTLKAQEHIDIPEGYTWADSIVYRPASTIDTTLVGKDIFLLMPDGADGKTKVEIHQTDVVKEAMGRHVAANASRELTGYRVRIFFDNKQSARVESEETLKRFESMYHDVVAYRSYANPYFKVTVGDFRTKSEAFRLLERIRHEFPSAFVVKESISFPVIDKENAYVVDTVKVLRPMPR